MTVAAAARPMTADDFLVWSLDQEERYELVDGRPVLMAGATVSHDRIVVNILGELRNRLRGGPCRPATADVAARMVRGNIRRPDVTVDCGDPAPTALESKAPVVFFEVLSPSTRSADFVRKAAEYQALPSLRHFALIEPGRVEVHLWTRGPDGAWPLPEELRTLDQTLHLPAIATALPLAEIYDGVTLDA